MKALKKHGRQIRQNWKLFTTDREIVLIKVGGKTENDYLCPYVIKNLPFYDAKHIVGLRTFSPHLIPEQAHKDRQLKY